MRPSVKRMGRLKGENIIKLLLVLVMVTFTACAWFDPDEEKSAQELASDGMEYFEREKYKKALQSFEQLKDFYPFSKFAILAELKMGDCHYHLEQYQEAIFTYEEFVELHPRNEAVPYVVYQIGHKPDMNFRPEIIGLIIPIIIEIAGVFTPVSPHADIATNIEVINISPGNTGTQNY